MNDIAAARWCIFHNVDNTPLPQVDKLVQPRIYDTNQHKVGLVVVVAYKGKLACALGCN